jgi:hypothetical protein
MTGFFPADGAVAFHLAVWTEDGQGSFHYRLDPKQAGKWIAVEEFGATQPRSDPFPADEVITILGDAIQREQDTTARRASEAQAAARDFAAALNEMLNTEQPDWWRLASEALARHPQYGS